MRKTETPLPTRNDVLDARETIAGRVHRTPTFSSAALGAHLKAELFQKTGSFKARGALNRIAALTPDRLTARTSRPWRMDGAARHEDWNRRGSRLLCSVCDL